jgi:hypothetical protein
MEEILIICIAIVSIDNDSFLRKDIPRIIAQRLMHVVNDYGI